MQIDFKKILGDENADKLTSAPLALIASGVVIAANLAFWFFVMPDIDANTEALLSRQGAVGSEISALEMKISEKRKQLAELPSLVDAYKAERASGLFDPEDRLKANGLLDEIKKRHVQPVQFEPITPYKFEMKPGEPFSFIVNGNRQTWFGSPSRIDFEVMHDSLAYPFIYDALSSLNGITVVRSLSIKRRTSQKLTDAMKTSVKDLKVSMPITVDLQYLWLTSDIKPDSEGGSKAGRK